MFVIFFQQSPAFYRLLLSSENIVLKMIRNNKAKSIYHITIIHILQSFIRQKIKKKSNQLQFSII